MMNSGINDGDDAATMLGKVLSYLRSSDASFENKSYSLSTNNSLPTSWLIQSAPTDTTCQLLATIQGQLDAIVKAQPRTAHFVDILHLGDDRVDDAFQLKMMDTIAAIAQVATEPVIVRYLEGNIPKSINFKFLNELKARYRGKSSSKVTFFSATLDYPWFLSLKGMDQGSWNHAKIVAIDGVTSIVGGQNYWSDYIPTGSNDVPHDVSINVNGEATISAHLFANYLWEYVSHPKSPSTQHKSWVLGEPSIGSDLPPLFDDGTYPTPSQPENIPILAVGNLGLWANFESRTLAEELVHALATEQVSPKNTYAELENAHNPQMWFPFSSFDYAESKATQASTTSRHLLLQSAETNGHIRISQQKIADTDVSSQTGIVFWPGQFLDAIIASLQRNVTVDILVSYHYADRTTPFGGYSDDMGGQALRGVIIDRLTTALQGDKSKAEGLAQKLLTIKQTPSETVNHSKVWIVDDKLFYVGSDNIYPGYLQEYGYVIGDEGKTAEFIEKYWNPIWNLGVAP